MSGSVEDGSRRVLLLGSYAPSLVNFRGPLIAAMAAAGHHVVAAAPDIDSQTAAGVRSLGGEPRSFSLNRAALNPLGMLESYRELRQLIRQVRPDVVIAYTIKPVILGAFAARAEKVGRIVLLITGLGFAFTGGRELKRWASRVAAQFLYRMALRLADVVIFQNSDDLKLFKALGLLRSSTSSAVINGSGIDLDRFSPKQLPVQLTFLMISRLLGDKGVREFGAAACRIKAERPHISVRLVGYLEPSPNSIRQEELDTIIAGGVEFLGHLPDVRPAIADCSVLVLPSYREGTPRSVLEAMAMGRPVITSDAPGCRETVIEGVNGYLVPPRDPDALYDAMKRFVEDPASIGPMGRASRRLAEDRYDVHKVTASILSLASL